MSRWLAATTLAALTACAPRLRLDGELVDAPQSAVMARNLDLFVDMAVISSEPALCDALRAPEPPASGWSIAAQKGDIEQPDGVVQVFDTGAMLTLYDAVLHEVSRDDIPHVRLKGTTSAGDAIHLTVPLDLDCDASFLFSALVAR